MELKHVARLVLTQFYFRDQPLADSAKLMQNLSSVRTAEESTRVILAELKLIHSIKG